MGAVLFAWYELQNVGAKIQYDFGKGTGTFYKSGNK